MSGQNSALRRIASALIAHAKKTMPSSRSEWAQAMECELQYLESDLNALMWAGGCVIASYTARGERKMDQAFVVMVKKPSALLPLIMSLAALALLASAYAFGIVTGQGGLVRQPDEGAVAHLWQLLMAGQLPVLLFFAIKWLPRAPRQSLCVLGLQTGAVIAAMAPVYFLHL
jgi:hypothetical protein